MKDWETAILTGIPRSGTTLSCYLLNHYSDVIALHEPFDIREFVQIKLSTLQLEFINSQILVIRDGILTMGRAPSLNIQGRGITDSFSDFIIDSNTPRDNQTHLSSIKIDKKLSGKFKLIIKHPSIFTGLLGDLSKIYKCVAVVRNPLAIISSWNSINTYHRTGRSPSAEIVDPELGPRLTAIRNIAERQIFLISWYFRIYQDLQNEIQIVRYEDIIATNGDQLFAKFGLPKQNIINQFELKSRNTNKFKEVDHLHWFFKELEKSSTAFQYLYNLVEIENLYEEMLSSF